MKVGDLVKWTNPSDEELGIAIEPWVDGFGDKHMVIYWFSAPEFSGPYPIGHKYLELLNESRRLGKN
jgi:hypothetical protein